MAVILCKLLLKSFFSCHGKQMGWISMKLVTNEATHQFNMFNITGQAADIKVVACLGHYTWLFPWDIKKLKSYYALHEASQGFSWSHAFPICQSGEPKHHCLTKVGAEWWFTLASSQYVDHFCTERWLRPDVKGNSSFELTLFRWGILFQVRQTR